MRLGMIWAQARDGVIGADGGLPWHLPEDLAHFKARTAGSTVVMGRRTWESLPERFRPLPGRRNIVLTTRTDYDAPGAEVVGSLDAALDPAADEVWVIGGATVYREAIRLADRLVVTEIDASHPGDVRAPDIDAAWRRTASDPADGWHKSSTGTPFRVSTYERAAAIASMS
jgi:dihydrofolate reductase